MSIFGPRRTVATLAESCDRCGAPGMVRYQKDGVVCIGEEAVEVKAVDLVACTFHVNLNGQELIRQGFVPVQVAS